MLMILIKILYFNFNFNNKIKYIIGRASRPSNISKYDWPFNQTATVTFHMVWLIILMQKWIQFVFDILNRIKPMYSIQFGSVWFWQPQLNHDIDTPVDRFVCGVVQESELVRSLWPKFVPYTRVFIFGCLCAKST